jgi:hypothetical protein
MLCLIHVQVPHSDEGDPVALAGETLARKTLSPPLWGCSTQFVLAPFPTGLAEIPQLSLSTSESSISPFIFGKIKFKVAFAADSRIVVHRVLISSM